MKIKLSHNAIIEVTEPYEFFDLMTKEEVSEFYQSLSCQELVIQHVVDQITIGCTEDGYSGGKVCGASINPSCALDKASRQIAEASGDIANDQISSLKKEIDRLQTNLNEAYDMMDHRGYFK